MKEFDGGLRKQHQISIGIDQSLTGFAFSAVSVESPSEHMTWVYKSPYSGVQRLYDISEWMRGRFAALAENPITDIAMEGTVNASFSASALGELAATVKLTLWVMFSHKKPLLATPLQIPPMTLKKYATGKGTAKKQEMLLQIYKRWGIEFNDDNAADAYSLARLAGKHVIDKVEQEVVDKITDVKYRDTIL